MSFSMSQTTCTSAITRKLAKYALATLPVAGFGDAAAPNIWTCNTTASLQPPRRSIMFAGDSAAAAHIPTCHDFFPSTDGYDTLIGFGTGDGMLNTYLPKLAMPSRVFKHILRDSALSAT